MTLHADFTTLQITESDDRLWVRLHRPEVRNAIDQQMVDELHAVCAYLERTPKILILAGTPGTAPTEANPKGIDNFSGFFLGGQDWRDGITWIFANGGDLAKKPEKSSMPRGLACAIVFTAALNSSSVVGTSTPASFHTSLR